jgi:hypothetical protein
LITEVRVDGDETELRSLTQWLRADRLGIGALVDDAGLRVLGYFVGGGVEGAEVGRMSGCRSAPALARPRRR